jgi:hypothetical protein
VSGTPDRDIARRDEVLELLYWLEGEGIAGSATLAGMARFLTCAEEELARTLDALSSRGDVALDPATAEYRLTPQGRREGARRFAEEFAPLLGRGHGECNDPDCDCLHEGPEACRHAHA